MTATNLGPDQPARPAGMELSATFALILDELRDVREAINGLGAQTVTPLIDAAAAGELLCVPASWVLSEARAGRIPHCRLGRYVRFRSDDLLAWTDGRAVGPRTREANGSGR